MLEYMIDKLLYTIRMKMNNAFSVVTAALLAFLRGYGLCPVVVWLEHYSRTSVYLRHGDVMVMVASITTLPTMPGVCLVYKALLGIYHFLFTFP